MSDQKSQSGPFKAPESNSTQHLPLTFAGTNHRYMVKCAVEEFKTPERKYDCQNYETCLGVAAALDWPSFVCSGCNGEVNKQLLWRAHSELKKEKNMHSVCRLPNL